MRKVPPCATKSHLKALPNTLLTDIWDVIVLGDQACAKRLAFAIPILRQTKKILSITTSRFWMRSLLWLLGAWEFLFRKS